MTFPYESLASLAKNGAGGITIEQLILGAMQGKYGLVGQEAIADLQSAAGDQNEPADAIAAIAAAQSNPPTNLAGALAAAGTGQSPAGMAAALANIAAGTAAAGTPDAPDFQKQAAAAAATAAGESPPGTPPPDYTSLITDIYNDIQTAISWPTKFGVWIVGFLGGQFVRFWTWLNNNIPASSVSWWQNISKKATQVVLGTDTVSEWIAEPGFFTALTVGNTSEEIVSVESGLQRLLYAPNGFIERFIGGLLKIPLLGTILLASFGPLTKQIEFDANYANPQERLALQTIIKLQLRGFIDLPTAQQNALYLGITADDFNSEYSAALSVISTQDALVMQAKGIITNAQLTVILTANGVATGDQSLLQQNAIRDQAISSTIGAMGRIAARSNGWLPGTLPQQAPQEVQNLYARALINNAQVDNDFISHWQLPSLFQLIPGYFRGIFNDTDLNNAALAENFPVELIPNIVAMSRPIIPLRVAATMLSRGTITQSQFTSILTAIGYTPDNIAILQEYVVPKKTPATKPLPNDLVKESISGAAELYTDGVYTQQQYQDVLAGHGYSADAVAATVLHTDTKNILAQRKAFATQLVDQVDLGQITVQNALDTLTQNGYTNQEILRYEKQMARGKAAKIKVPTYAQAAKMASSQIITWAEFATFLQSENYDQNWIPYLVQLEGGPSVPANSNP